MQDRNKLALAHVMVPIEQLVRAAFPETGNDWDPETIEEVDIGLGEGIQKLSAR